MKKLSLLGIAGVLLVLVPACSYGAPSGNNPPASETGGNSISISNLALSSPKLTVTSGTTITWTNKDSIAHTVTSTTGTFDSGNMIPGASFSYTFNAAGSYDYTCTVHPYIKGTVTVQ